MIEKGRTPVSDGWTESYSDPPVIVNVSMIVDRGLTAAEKTKFKRLESRISTLFATAGVVIRVCEGTGEGDRRTIGFVPGLIGFPLMSFEATHFLAASEDELLHSMEAGIEKMSKGT